MKSSMAKLTWRFDRYLNKFVINVLCGELLFSLLIIFDISLTLFWEANQGELNIRKYSNFIMQLFLSIPVKTPYLTWVNIYGLLTYDYFLFIRVFSVNSLHWWTKTLHSLPQASREILVTVKQIDSWIHFFFCRHQGFSAKLVAIGLTQTHCPVYDRPSSKLVRWLAMNHWPGFTLVLTACLC